MEAKRRKNKEGYRAEVLGYVEIEWYFANNVD